MKSNDSTISVHSGTVHDEFIGGINTPIFTSSAIGYLQTDMVRYPRYYNTPNQHAVAEKLAALEHAEDGLVFSSGMAAITTIFMALMQKGDHLILSNDIYGGTTYLVESTFQRVGIEYSFVDASVSDNFLKAIRPNTKLIYIETPSNPLLKITDVAAVAKIARAKNITTAIDNTFASPINQKPIDLGIDIVMHSATKYLSGHSDMCAGAIAGSKKLIQQIKECGYRFGGSLDAQACYLLERSMKTLAIRMDRHNLNGMAIAKYLSSHQGVNHVYYPGLEKHAGHETARNQMTGFGGMMSFEVKGGLREAEDFMKKLKYIKPAVSLGGVESLVCSPVRTSHAKVSADERARQGIRDSLIRFSVGIEDLDDLIGDLSAALK